MSCGSHAKVACKDALAPLNQHSMQVLTEDECSGEGRRTNRAGAGTRMQWDEGRKGVVIGSNYQ